MHATTATASFTADRAMPSEVTRLLRAVAAGDDEASARLAPLVYDELRVLARVQLRGERAGHSLQPTELVHEAFMRLAAGEPDWQSRAHFFGAAANAMRRVLIEHARRKAAAKRGGARVRVTFHDLGIAAEEPDVDLLALDEALTALAAEDERLARIVHLRWFAGCSIPQTAELLGISPATVKRDWAFARAWLRDRMGDV